MNEVLEPIKRLAIAAYSNQHWAQASSTSIARQRFRQEAFTAYDAFNDTKAESWCVVTGIWWPTWAVPSVVPYVQNAHIVCRSKSPNDWVSVAALKNAVS
jgi:hypothetical protein